MALIRDVHAPRPPVSRERGGRSRSRWAPLLLSAVALAGGLCSCGDRGIGCSPLPAGRVVVAADATHPFPHLVVSGSPRWMGLEQGRLLREAIRATVARDLARPEVAGARTFLAPVRALLPPAVEDELKGIAEGAGVSADDLFLLEVAREGRRWQAEEPGLLEAAFAGAPAPGSPLVIALEGLGRAAMPEPLVVIERHGDGSAATLCLSYAGGLGGIVGVSSSGLAAGAGEVEVAPERRSIKGLPMAIALRLGLERATGPADLLARLPGLSGHRAVAAGPDGTRASALLSLVAEPPEMLDPQAWLLVAAGPRSPTNPRTLALERRLAGYAERPGPDNAVDLAVAGRSPSAVGPVLIASPAGLLVRPEVGSSGTSPSPVEVSYAWAGQPAPAPGPAK